MTENRILALEFVLLRTYFNYCRLRHQIFNFQNQTKKSMKMKLFPFSSENNDSKDQAKITDISKNPSSKVDKGKLYTLLNMKSRDFKGKEPVVAIGLRINKRRCCKISRKSWYNARQSRAMCLVQSFIPYHEITRFKTATCCSSVQNYNLLQAGADTQFTLKQKLKRVSSWFCGGLTRRLYLSV